MSSTKNFIPYTVVLDIGREDDSYCLFEALQHYRQYLSAQDRPDQVLMHSVRRLLDMVDTAWVNSANMTTDRD